MNRNGNGKGLELLPTELLFAVTGFLNVESLLSVSVLNKTYNELGKRNDAGWKWLCRELWKGKIFYPKIEEDDQVNFHDAYRDSLLDARNRHYITVEELVFDPETEEGTIWNFRFKETAGQDWISWDPWFNARPARQMVMLQDGRMKQYLEKGSDPLNDFLAAPNAENGIQLSAGTLVEPPVPMAWRFANQPMDLPNQPQGSYIRFTVGGRDVPTYCVRRSPTGNWGFLAESCWGVYTSFPMPMKKARITPNVIRSRRPESLNGRFNAEEALGEDVNDLSDDVIKQEEEVTLADDSAFIITNDVQWREALLYNFGATLLPEGQNATADFDRMFGQQVTPENVAAASEQGDQAAGFIAQFMEQQAVAEAEQQRQPEAPVEEPGESNEMQE
mmetsp:Transcript_23322/g.33437  ORF Transcript_23322/g.33437 Transcript_23322/m.33437 type:complete len:389 (+) Transcript_23322:3-1169(+)